MENNTVGVDPEID